METRYSLICRPIYYKEDELDGHNQEPKPVFKKSTAYLQWLEALALAVSILFITAYILWRILSAHTPYLDHGIDRVSLAKTSNGTYKGTYLAGYSQYRFVGMPYAAPPVGPLRFRVAQPLNVSWDGIREATQYGPQCLTYGVGAP
jgi:hypothetical protein